MLSGPAILRISLLLIIAGILAAVVQALLPSPAPAPVSQPVPPQVAEPPAVVQPSPPTPVPAPAAGSDRGLNASPPTDAPPQIAAAPAAPGQMPSDALAFPSDPAAQGQAPAQPQGQEAAAQAEVEKAEDSAGPRALAVVDLNTASVADLNRLRGGGAIGRAIVAKRPYTSVEQLLSKRVLSRAVYERIKDQVTVR
ncbi:helix-hairpin-helix domain-containing protein [Methylobacterium sp. J-030]|uniref:helix-hairpin-helix domain-containing protein n=1 Tax=Methylobacterium sp. J-030 TaxID=2836627 RepID=UPI001FBB513C|nr:helix-hairpin-helix domain-containing protein [Methylobacterium sp. J-030]MCJ2069878.1 helix-hairpin-helix domain-containing protein [Methylobacterium sp. J-030]